MAQKKKTIDAEDFSDYEDKIDVEVEESFEIEPGLTIPQGKSEEERKKIVYNSFCTKLINFIDKENIINVDEARTLFRYSQDGDPAWDALFESKAVKEQLKKTRTRLVVELRNKMINGKSFPERQAALRLICNDEELARLNGGGVKLDDVKRIDKGAPAINVLTAGINISKVSKPEKLPKKKITIPSPAMFADLSGDEDDDDETKEVLDEGTDE